MEDRIKKWQKTFTEADRRYGAGIYLPRFFKTRRGLILGDNQALELSEEKVFEVSVDVEGTDFDYPVTFVTDSVEVLKVLSIRGFPLISFAQKIHESRQTEIAEMIFDIGIINDKGLLEISTISLRVIPRPETLTFEVRMIK